MSQFIKNILCQQQQAFVLKKIINNHKNSIIKSANFATQASSIQKHLPSTSSKHLSLLLNHSINRLNSQYVKLNMAKALVIGADGSESSELVVLTNILRRGKVATKLVAVDPAKKVIQCSDGTKILPDATIDEAIKQDYNAIILPGGMGARDAYIAAPNLGEILKKQEASGKIVAAICAAPTALAHFGIGQKKKITTYPSLGGSFEGKDYIYVKDQTVVVDGNLVTSQGPFTTYAFALKLVELLVDKKTSDEVASAMLVKL